MCEIATYKQKFLKQTILADKFPLEVGSGSQCTVELCHINIITSSYHSNHVMSCVIKDLQICILDWKDCCLFKDITKLSDENQRHCVVHNRACVPELNRQL